MSSVVETLSPLLDCFDPSSVPPSGVDLRLAAEIEKGLDVLVEACAVTTDIDDDLLFEILVEAGIADHLADRILAFAPIGFAHVVLHHLVLPKEFDLRSECGAELGIRSLTSSPEFLVARRYAASKVHSGPDRAPLLNIAVRCSHVAVAEHFLSEGKDISELWFYPLVVAVPEDPDA